MPIPDTLHVACKITADFGAEKKYGGRKKFCDTLRPANISFQKCLMILECFTKNA